MATRSLSCEENSRGVALTTRLHVSQTFRLSIAILLPPPSVPAQDVTGRHSHLIIVIIFHNKCTMVNKKKKVTSADKWHDHTRSFHNAKI
jgi:hypothetical protein